MWQGAVVCVVVGASYERDTTRSRCGATGDVNNWAERGRIRKLNRYLVRCAAPKLHHLSRCGKPSPPSRDLRISPTAALSCSLPSILSPPCCCDPHWRRRPHSRPHLRARPRPPIRNVEPASPPDCPGYAISAPQLCSHHARLRPRTHASGCHYRWLLLTCPSSLQASASPCPLASSPRSSSLTSVPSSHGSTSPSSSAVWPSACSTLAIRLVRSALAFSRSSPWRP